MNPNRDYTLYGRSCARLAVRDDRAIHMPSLYDRFSLVSDFELAGDQARAIGELTEGLDRGDPHQVLLGVTGSGKTFTMAQTIAAGEPADAGDGPQQDAGGAALPGVPPLLPRERRRVLRQLLRLLPARGLRAGDRLVHREGSDDQRRDRPACGCRPRGRCSSAATSSSSPACRASTAWARPRRTTACCCRSSAASASAREQVLRKLVEIQYERNDHDFGRGTFRVRGDIVEVYPLVRRAGPADRAVRRRGRRADRRSIR